MLLITDKEIHEKFLGNSYLYSYETTKDYPESEDGMRRGWSEQVNVVYTGTLELLETKDGKYKYDFTFEVREGLSPVASRTVFDEYYREKIPRVIADKYNLGKFTLIEENTNTIVNYDNKNYALLMHLKLDAYKMSFSYDIVDRNSNIDKYKICRTPYEIFDEAYKGITKEQYVDSAIGKDICSESYVVYIPEKDEDTALISIRDKLKLNLYLADHHIIEENLHSLDSLVENGVVTIEELYNILDKKLISNNMNEATKFSYDILDKLCTYNKSILDKFNHRTVDPRILRKYLGSEVDLLSIKPHELTYDDLIPLLKRINEVREDDNEIYPYRSMYDYVMYITANMTAENSREVVDLALSSPHLSKDFKAEIVQTANDLIKDTETNRELLNKLINADVDYSSLKRIGVSTDDLSIDDLLKVISVSDSIYALELVDIINKCRDYGLNDKTINGSLCKDLCVYCDADREVLKTIKFNADISSGWIYTSIKRNTDCTLLDILAPDINADYLVLKLLGVVSLEDINFNTMFNKVLEWDNIESLFNRLTPDIKSKIKTKILNEIEDSEIFSGKSSSSLYLEYFTIYKLMKILGGSYNDMRELLLKLVSATCNSPVDIVKKFELSQDEVAEVEKVRGSIYPTPSYSWLGDKNKIDIWLGGTYDRNSLKDKIKSDGRCFRIKVITSAEGSKDGNRIPISNLSKWLFGVPNVRGNLVLNRYGDRVLLPPNTPDTAINLIKDIFGTK